MTEILLTGPLSLNSINKQVRAAVIGLIALKFDSKAINIFAIFYIKNPNLFIKSFGQGKNITDSLPPVFGLSILFI